MIGPTSGRGLARVSALAVGALVEVLRRVLRRSDPDLEDKVVAGGPDRGDGPPPEEGPHLDAVEAGDPSAGEIPGDPRGVRGEVVVGGEGDAAAVAELDGEVAGGAVEGVAADVAWEKADGEATKTELVVGGDAFRVRVRIFGEGWEGEGEEGDDDEEEGEKFRHCFG